MLFSSIPQKGTPSLRTPIYPKKQLSYGGQMKNAHDKFDRGIKMKHISV
jgi:hypothetical protein